MSTFPAKISWLLIWPVFAVLIGLYGFQSGWIAIFLYHSGILVAARATVTPWTVVGKGFRPAPAIALWIVGLGGAPILFYLLPVFLGLSVDETRTALQLGLEKSGMVGHSFNLFVIYLCLPNPAIEEIGWRKLLFVDSKMPHLCDLAFGFYHLLVLHYFFPFAWTLFAASLFGLATMGWIWRQLVIRFDGLAVPICFHAGGDFGAMLGLWWLLR